MHLPNMVIFWCCPMHLFNINFAWVKVFSRSSNHVFNKSLSWFVQWDTRAWPRKHCSCNNWTFKLQQYLLLMAIFIDFNARFDNICVTIVTIRRLDMALPWLDLPFTFMVLIKISTFTCPDSVSPFVWHVWVHSNNNATRLDKWRDYAISFAISRLQAPHFGTYALFETHNWWLLGGRTQNKTCLVRIGK